jgi:hypothetical protein
MLLAVESGTTDTTGTGVAAQSITTGGSRTSFSKGNMTAVRILLHISVPKLAEEQF